MDLILEMAAAAVGSSSFFWFSGSAAETIPIAAAIAATMTAIAAAKISCPNKEFLTDNTEEPVCRGGSA